ncbi:MAG: hypothetical protein SVT56_13850, partial [Chloroflexota bacterium]|nr:hypothetical protein [Chloroflexota bacterium]
LALFGIEVSEPRSFSVSHIWQHLFNELYSAEAVGNDEILKCVQRILSSGTLSTRINRAVPDGYGKTEIAAVYRKLCECLNKGEFFTSDE